MAYIYRELMPKEPSPLLPSAISFTAVAVAVAVPRSYQGDILSPK